MLSSLWQQVCSSSCISSWGTKFAAYCSSHFNIVLHCVCTLCREVCYVFWICYSGNHVRFWWVTHDGCQPMMNPWPMAWVQVLVGVGMHLGTCGFTHAIHYLDFAIWGFQSSEINALRGRMRLAGPSTVWKPRPNKKGNYCTATSINYHLSHRYWAFCSLFASLLLAIRRFEAKIF